MLWVPTVLATSWVPRRNKTEYSATKQVDLKNCQFHWLPWCRFVARNRKTRAGCSLLEQESLLQGNQSDLPVDNQLRVKLACSLCIEWWKL